MRQKRALAVMVFVLTVLALGFNVSNSMGGSGGGKTAGGRVEWVTFTEGFALAAKENKLLVIDFYTDWCHWCKVMDKETYGSQVVVDYGKDKVIFAKINAETEEKVKYKGAHYSGRELAQIFGVSGFPMTAFVNAKGELITSVPGFIPAETFQRFLKYLAEGWYKKIKYDEFEKQEAANKG